MSTPPGVVGTPRHVLAENLTENASKTNLRVTQEEEAGNRIRETWFDKFRPAETIADPNKLS